MAQPTLPQGPATGTGFEQWIRKEQDAPSLYELLKQSPSPDKGGDDSENDKEKQQSK